MPVPRAGWQNMWCFGELPTRWPSDHQEQFLRRVRITVPRGSWSSHSSGGVMKEPLMASRGSELPSHHLQPCLVLKNCALGCQGNNLSHPPSQKSTQSHTAVKKMSQFNKLLSLRGSSNKVLHLPFTFQPCLAAQRHVLTTPFTNLSGKREEGSSTWDHSAHSRSWLMSLFSNVLL